MVDIISFALGGITVEAWWVKCVGKGKSQVQSPQMRIAEKGFHYICKSAVSNDARIAYIYTYII